MSTFRRGRGPGNFASEGIHRLEIARIPDFEIYRVLTQLCLHAKGTVVPASEDRVPGFEAISLNVCWNGCTVVFMPIDRVPGLKAGMPNFFLGLGVLGLAIRVCFGL